MNLKWDKVDDRNWKASLFGGMVELTIFNIATELEKDLWHENQIGTYKILCDGAEKFTLPEEYTSFNECLKGVRAFLEQELEDLITLAYGSSTPEPPKPRGVSTEDI